MPEKRLLHTSGAAALINRTIKAIPTRWRGRQYRSRLEARWAVAFETLGLKFLYEPEGFEMPDGTRYLPDFYLPEVKWFAEVKPFSHNSSKAYQFVKHSNNSVLILDGDPTHRSYTGLMPCDAGPEHLEFSLDIWTYRKAFMEGRLWSWPDYERMGLNLDALEECFSIRYRAAVEAGTSAGFAS